MRLYADLIGPDGEVNADLWEQRAATGTAVGRCGCGEPIDGYPADVQGSMTYRDVVCPADHESTILGLHYRGRTIGPTPGAVDITTARHPKED